MTTVAPIGRHDATQRHVRLLTLLRSAAEVGMEPLALDAVHALAYLADALSPVWHLPPLDGQLLKRELRPFFPELQRDLDELIGLGVVEVVRFEHIAAEDGSGWRLDAEVRLVPEHARPVLAAIDGLPEQASKAAFVREVVYAASGLGLDGVNGIARLDASYSDPTVDVGGVIDVGPGSTNLSARAALTFRTLAGADRRLTEPELVHLYVRHLYKRMAGA